MPKYRSATTTHGRNMAGARALWRATGMTDADFGKPIIAVVNSFTQFKPLAAWRKSSIPSPWMTGSQWGTGACFIHCRRAS